MPIDFNELIVLTKQNAIPTSGADEAEKFCIRARASGAKFSKEISKENFNGGILNVKVSDAREMFIFDIFYVCSDDSLSKE
mgnify:CR=1 FL=1